MPEIRFDGFAGEWEFKPFGEIVERKSAVTRVTGGLNLEFEDIVSGAGVLNKDLTSKPNNKPGVPFSVGDVLFGKLRPYLRNWLRPDFDGVAVGDFWVLRPVEADSAFVYSTIQRSDFMRVANMSSGTKMPRSDWRLVSETIFGCPSLSEQADVGSFFSHLDTVLDAGEKKLQKLRALKQTMLTKMFPQGDSRVPEIRFESFESEWTEQPFNETFQFGRSVVLSRADLNDEGGDGKSVHYGDILTKFGYMIDTSVDDLPFITDSSVVSKNLRSKLSNGDVIMADTAEDDSVGRCVEIRVNSGVPVFAGLHTHALRPLNAFAEGFIGVLMNSPTIHDQIVHLSQGTKVTSVSKDALNSLLLLVPSEPEQEVISAYFREFDVLLDAESQKLEKLRHLKSAFLSSMFV